MPLTRYQVRNVHSLADPDLYREADKDDPEALLEGVAMAGLVGVLRQLGDLAEFAAEIFHDLHEEVMATAARGHGLMDRVQQLEAEFPLIEKAFLSQTSHTSFFYNTGIGSHPNLRMDQNLITQRDMPRFVMDSYEECRGPPRLFLLDKFDVGGAGACLKRYTDPSFFKSSSSEMTDLEVQREKKSRKTKKKGFRGRNGETPDVTPASHAKLHQLFLEEHVENGITNPARRVKLKRRLNGFPFDSRTGKSYMEKLFKAPPEVVHEISVGSSHLQFPSNIAGESGLEIHEISTVSPEKELTLRKRSLYASSNIENTLKPSMDELNEDVNDGLSEVSDGMPKQDLDFEAHNNLATYSEVVDEKDIEVDGGNKTEGIVDGYQSDDIASETDNYLDALATMDSEMETDSEYRAKNDFADSSIEEPGTDTDGNAELQELSARSLDSRSFGNSITSDDRNRSVEKEILSFSCSDSVSVEGDYIPSDGGVSAKVFPPIGIYEAEIVDVSPDPHSAEDKIPIQAVSDGACSEVAEIPDDRSEIVEPPSSSRLADVAPSPSPSPSPLGPELNAISYDCNGMDSHVRIEENGTKLGDNSPCSSDVLDVSSQTRDDSVSALSDNHPEAVEPNVSSITARHFSNILEASLQKESSEDLLDDVCQAEYAEYGGSKNGIESHIDSPKLVISPSKEQPIDAVLPELEISDADANPGDIVFVGDDASSSSGDTTLNISPSSKTTNFKDKQLSETVVAVPPLEINSAETCTSYSGERNLDMAFNTENGKVIGGVTARGNVVGGAARTEIPFKSRNSSDSAINVEAQSHMVNVAKETVQSQVLAVDYATSVTNNVDNVNSSSLNSTKLVEESLSSDGDLCQNPLEINEASLPDYFKNAEKETDQEAVASSDLDSILSNTASCDHPKLELFNDVTVSYTTEDADSRSHPGDAITVPLSSDENGEDLGSKSLTHSDAMKNSDDVVSSPDHHLGELRVPLEQKLDVNVDRLDLESHYAFKDGSNSSFQLEQIQPPIQLDHDRCFDASEISQPYPTSAPLVSDLSMQESHKLDVSEKAAVSSSSFFPGFALLPDSTQINLEDMPPLPPLPPMQWRMGKPQHVSLPSERDFPPSFPSMANGKVQPGDIPQPPNVLLPLSDGKDNQHVYESFGGNLVQSSPFSSQGLSTVDHGISQPDFLTSGRGQSTNPFLTSPVIHNERPEIQESVPNPFSTEKGVQDIPFTYLPRPSQETSLENEKPPISTIFEKEVVVPVDSSLPHSSLPPQKMEDEQPHHEYLTSEGESAESSSRSDPVPACDLEKPNGNRQLKLPRPRSPLIDAVAAHDKSKLRSVTERVRPQIAQKVEERDSLLEQIRAKSFNLKPAAVTRPIIQGPKTNLKLAAILEKANAIRQALAGSDEDDDPDSWSDS